ncbi:T9SS type A sorting domain-containing protein [bacterium]|nr:T9SS type A sorting domain-containing protein [bacterium]
MHALKIVGIAILALAAFSSPVLAQYDSSSAMTLPLNGSSSGSMSADYTSYWWKVTTTADGYLTVSTHSDESLEIDTYLYDVDGATQIAGYDISWGVDSSSHYSNLRPGTYYFLAVRYGGTGNYTVTSSFKPTRFDNDIADNDSAAVAFELDKNGTDTGHLGFYSGGYIDGADWWKVTTTFDGRLNVSAVSDSTLELDTYLYEKTESGFQQIAGYDISWGIESPTHYNNLLPGTYYVGVYRYGGYGSYTIRSSFTPTKFDDDVADNDSAAVAVNLGKDGTDTGHLGFYARGYTDTEDWWKITIPLDGRLNVSTLSDSTLEIDTYLYENIGTEYPQITGYDISWGIESASHYNNLLPGTYYMRVIRYGGYGSYTVRSSFTPANLDNDVADNDSASVAFALNRNGTDTGHLGFYARGYTDTEDWWKITIPGDGKLSFTTRSDSTLEIDTYLYEQNGSDYPQIAGYDISWGIESVSHHNNLLPGTYYARVIRYGGYGSYSIASTFVPATYPNDTEPNDSLAVAMAIPVNTVKTGHLGYYGKGYADPRDFLAFTVPSGWDSLFVRVSTENTIEVDVNLHNNIGEQIAHEGSWGTESVFYYGAPAAGQYFLNVYDYSGYGSYAVIVTNHWQNGIQVNLPTEILPPTNIAVTDVTGDNGHALKISWALSASENSGIVNRYRIFRSRSSAFTDPVPLTQFASLDSLLFYETRVTVLVDSVAAGVSQFIDTSVPLDGASYYYWIQATGTSGMSKPAPSGAWLVTGVAEAPVAFRVDPPYPNPFNPATTIRYALPSEAFVRIVVYDIIGRKVAVLTETRMGAGVHEAVWDGRSENGETLGSGVYLYRLDAGSFHGQGKMMLLR